MVPSNAATGCLAKTSMHRLNIGSGMLRLSSCMLWLSMAQPYILSVQGGRVAPERRFGPIFNPNGHFSIHFGPILMFWGWTRTLVSRDLDLGTFGQPMIWTWPDLTWPRSACSGSTLAQACSGSAHACSALASDPNANKARGGSPPLALNGFGSSANAEHA